jgi:hypothetical protein
LVKGLRKHFEEMITNMGASYIATLLQEYAAGGENAWKAKDVAIYLVTALTVTAASQEKGAVKTNQLVPIVEWFSANIFPELQAAPTNHPIIQADCLRFAAIFAGIVCIRLFVSQCGRLLTACRCATMLHRLLACSCQPLSTIRCCKSVPSWCFRRSTLLAPMLLVVLFVC